MVEVVASRAAAVEAGPVGTLPAFNLVGAELAVSVALAGAAESAVSVALAAAVESAVSVVVAVSGILLAEAGTSRMVRVQPVGRLAVAAIPSVALLESEPQQVGGGSRP
jgi:hypothetical protein